MWVWVLSWRPVLAGSSYLTGRASTGLCPGSPWVPGTRAALRSGCWLCSPPRLPRPRSCALSSWWGWQLPGPPSRSPGLRPPCRRPCRRPRRPSASAGLNLLLQSDSIDRDSRSCKSLHVTRRQVDFRSYSTYNSLASKFPCEDTADRRVLKGPVVTINSFHMVSRPADSPRELGPSLPYVRYRRALQTNDCSTQERDERISLCVLEVHVLT